MRPDICLRTQPDLAFDIMSPTREAAAQLDALPHRLMFSVVLILITPMLHVPSATKL